jgi:hypothetical protein
VSDRIEIGKIEHAGRSFSGKCIPGAGNSLEMPVAEGKIAGNGIEPPNGLRIAPSALSVTDPGLLIIVDPLTFFLPVGSR